jgi:long-chain acyl-CoA synthetase
LPCPLIRLFRRGIQDKTAETIGPDGWLHSGDIADMDADGFWKITGRIKELIITAGGENIVSGIGVP